MTQFNPQRELLGDLNVGPFCSQRCANPAAGRHPRDGYWLCEHHLDEATEQLDDEAHRHRTRAAIGYEFFEECA